MSTGVKENLVSLETLMKKNLFTCSEIWRLTRSYLPSTFVGEKNLNFYPSLPYLWLSACAAHDPLPVTVQMNSCLYETAFFPGI